MIQFIKLQEIISNHQNMLKKTSLIFVVEDDIPCGKLVEFYLKRNGYSRVFVFTDENAFMREMIKKPKVVITDYRLKKMNGIELIKSAREIYSNFYCVLLSGMNYDEIFPDEMPHIHLDKYIRKGLDSLDELQDTLDAWAHIQKVEQFY